MTGLNVSCDDSIMFTTALVSSVENRCLTPMDIQLVAPKKVSELALLGDDVTRAFRGLAQLICGKCHLHSIWLHINELRGRRGE